MITLAWKIPWTEEPRRLQSLGLLWVGHDWAASLSLFTFMHWRRKWQPTPVFLPGESQGRGSLVGCRLWGHTESDMTEATQQQEQQHDCFTEFFTEINRIFCQTSTEHKYYVLIYFNSCIHPLIDCDKTTEELLCGPTSCLWGNQPTIVNELSSLNPVRIF